MLRTKQNHIHTTPFHDARPSIFNIHHISGSGTSQVCNRQLRIVIVIAAITVSHGNYNYRHAGQLQICIIFKTKDTHGNLFAQFASNRTRVV